MSRTPDFANPPIVELVLGAQFSPLTKFTAAHFGLLWKLLGDSWIDPADASPLEEQFETFDRPHSIGSLGIELRLQPTRRPGRLMFGHAKKDRLLQVQSTRFHLNWRKSSGGVYLSYKALIGEFEATLARFSEFVEASSLGPLQVNQWEVTYVDAFPHGEYWQTSADWGSILPGLFGTLQAADRLRLESRAAEWCYEIEPQMGRLHVAASLGRFGDDQREALILNMTARGAVGKGGVETLRFGLDLGHDVAVETFLRVTAHGLKKKWEATP